MCFVEVVLLRNLNENVALTFVELFCTIILICRQGLNVLCRSYKLKIVVNTLIILILIYDPSLVSSSKLCCALAQRLRKSAAYFVVYWFRLKQVDVFIAIVYDIYSIITLELL